jgi:acyl carrier protein phosphodiesterase
VNFFGHAVMAHGHRRSAAFALGAMLPDFASMCQGRLASAADADVAAGIDFHHRIDAAFHRLPDFARLCRDAESRFRRAGARKGPARGAAHAGTELLLDGAWLDDPGAATYLEALDAAHPAHLGACLSWEHPSGATRFETLRTRLAARGIPLGYRDPSVVADILVHILSPRPLLAPSPDDIQIFRAELPALQPLVHDAAPALRAGLG